MQRRFLIRQAAGDEMNKVAALFRAYADGLDVDLSYQGFEAELAGLPGAYAPPGGALLLATSNAGDPLGCVGVRPLPELLSPEHGTCEMKRLYTTPAARGTGVGRALAMAAIDAGARAGYSAMRLDTLPGMVAAQSLYRRLGFEVTPAYYRSQVDGTIFMRKTLGPPSGHS